MKKLYKLLPLLGLFLFVFNVWAQDAPTFTVQVEYSGYRAFGTIGNNNTPELIMGWMLRSAVHVISDYDESSIPVTG